MSKQRYAVRHKRSIYSGFLDLDAYDATVTLGDQTVEIERLVHDHGHGAAVLPYDEARKTAILVRQLRVPVHVAGDDGLILEAAAGLIDPEDENPAAAAIREAREELGYTIHDPEPVTTFYSIPGLVTERISCFLARYTPADKLAGDTGADEDEVLEVEEWPLPALWEAYERGTLTDVKAIVCLMALRLKRPDLFSDGA